jgi:hypothetical protein
MSNWNMNCQLFRVSRPGADSYAIFYDDGTALYVVYNPATKRDAQAKLTTRAGVMGLERNGWNVKPVAPRFDFENSEGAGGISMKFKMNGPVVPAICVGGDIYFRSGNSVSSYPSPFAAVKAGMILASREDIGWPKNDV